MGSEVKLGLGEEGEGGGIVGRKHDDIRLVITAVRLLRVLSSIETPICTYVYNRKRRDQTTRPDLNRFGNQRGKSVKIYMTDYSIDRRKQLFGLC